MTRTLAALTLFGLVTTTTCLMAPAQAAPRGSVPPESFLNYHAASVHELAQEVTLDPAVRTRLARHFHVTPAQMTAYVRQNLVLTHLKSAGVYRVACVRADGSEYWVNERLPAGTPVFASRATGKPILKLACGNPMATDLPPVTKLSDDQALHTSPKLALIPSTLQTPSSTPMLASAVAPEYAFTSDALTIPPVAVVGGSIQSIIPVRGGGGFPLGYLAGIPVIASLVGHGSGSSNSPFIPPVPPVPPVQPVPETSTVLSLALLLGSLGAVALRRKHLAPH